jgi:glutaredoxin-related protein
LKEQKIVWEAVDGLMLSDLRNIVLETNDWEHNARVYVKTKFSGGTADGVRIKKIVVTDRDPRGGNPAAKA